MGAAENVQGAGCADCVPGAGCGWSEGRGAAEGGGGGATPGRGCVGGGVHRCSPRQESAGKSRRFGPAGWSHREDPSTLLEEKKK